jgi:tRNA U34 2-thiouridine synthase MnmA/TrmU
MLNVPLTVENITSPYLDMLMNPNCGYGRNMNPCLDCHALMFKCAGRYLENRKFDFLFSGEVLGQRPMSQKKGSLRYVEKHSGFDGYILRPLSARALPETVPEKRGLVERERLLDISGRGRKVQLGLAEKYGITEFPAPAGGCLLTDPGFSTRLRDLFDHVQHPSEREIHLLKHGRHFRLDTQTKAIVGRTKQDNADIRRYLDRRHDTVVHVLDSPGPTVLITGDGSREAVLLAASICARYSKSADDRPAKIHISAPTGRQTVEVLPMSSAESDRFLI